MQPSGLNSLTRAIDGESNATFLEKFEARASTDSPINDDVNSGAEAAEARRREAGENSAIGPGERN
jgi:hypothetical protein